MSFQGLRSHLGEQTSRVWMLTELRITGYWYCSDCSDGAQTHPFAFETGLLMGLLTGA